MINPEALSSLLLDLYAKCQVLPMTDYLPHVLHAIKKQLPFDSAWWAMSTTIDEHHEIHGSYIDGLPADMANLWVENQTDEVIGRAVMNRPEQTINFRPVDVDKTPGSRLLAERGGFRHVLCTCCENKLIGQRSFLALSRHDERNGFREDERRFKELLMPHINATMSMNRVAQLRQERALGKDVRVAMAVVDRRGAIHTVEPGVIERLSSEWSDWKGALLPTALRAAIDRADTLYLGEKIQASFSWMGDVALMELRQICPVDRLSPREREVGQAFASGLSYKEVARDLHMAPATVRHHLRSIYVKLGVDNKAGVAHAFLAPTAFQ